MLLNDWTPVSSLGVNSVANEDICRSRSQRRDDECNGIELMLRWKWKNRPTQKWKLTKKYSSDMKFRIIYLFFLKRISVGRFMFQHVHIVPSHFTYQLCDFEPD